MKLCRPVSRVPKISSRARGNQQSQLRAGKEVLRLLGGRHGCGVWDDEGFGIVGKGRYWFRSWRSRRGEDENREEEKNEGQKQRDAVKQGPQSRPRWSLADGQRRRGVCLVGFGRVHDPIAQCNVGKSCR